MLANNISATWIKLACVALKIIQFKASKDSSTNFEILCIFWADRNIYKKQFSNTHTETETDNV